MAKYQENPSKLLSVSSWQNGDLFDSWNAEAFEGDEEFYEEIEAPKFVDFTVPDHYCPDDRYWFCLRVGCDQKHEEEMDSEALYKKFVLRLMAARSPNVRLRKTLDRNASRKCPLSAPPKPSKPRLSRMAIISSISKKVNDKEKVVRPLSKTKPVAAKYLTAPRSKKCIQNENSFRSVQNPKPTNIEVSKSRMVAKALVFHSPKKAIKIKTSVELRTPVSKLCKEMNKLEITRKPSNKSWSSSCTSRQLSSHKVQRKPEESLGTKTCTNQEYKSGKSIKSKIKGKLSERKALKNEESREIKQESAQKVAEEFESQNSILEESCMPSMVPPSMNKSDLALSDDSKKKGNCSQATNMQENNSSDGKENVGHLIANNSSEGERDEHDDDECMDGDNKENAATSDENRMHSKNLMKNGRKIFSMHDQSGQVRKKVTQAHDKNSKEGLISSSPVVKLKKPKATNPKPFRLRTDERGILKEANLEKRTDRLNPQSESATLNTPSVKLQRKQENDNLGLKISKGQERSKPAAAVTPESKKHRDKKPIGSPLESNAMQRLEKFRKIKSPLHKHSIRPLGLVSTKNKMASFLIPGKKLDVIHENSPEVLELKRAGKTNVPPSDAAASRSSSRGRRPITVGTEPNFHSTHVTRTCTKKLK